MLELAAILMETDDGRVDYWYFSTETLYTGRTPARLSQSTDPTQGHTDCNSCGGGIEVPSGSMMFSRSTFSWLLRAPCRSPGWRIGFTLEHEGWNLSSCPSAHGGLWSPVARLPWGYVSTMQWQHKSDGYETPGPIRWVGKWAPMVLADTFDRGRQPSQPRKLTLFGL